MQTHRQGKGIRVNRVNAQRSIWFLPLVALAAALVALSATANLVGAHAAGYLVRPAAAGTKVQQTSSLSGPQSGPLVQIPNCLQAPPQSVKDRASYTPAELAKYGLPPRTPGEPLAKWQRIVRSAGQRVCSYHQSTDRWAMMVPNFQWAGNYADEDTPGQTYTEADMDYFVACINGHPSDPSYGNADYGAWIGIGGVYTNNSLVQAGTAGFQTFNSMNGWQNTYWTFTEDLADASDQGAHYQFAVSCNNHIYAKAWDSGSMGCMFVMRIDDGKNAQDCRPTSPTNPHTHSDEQSGEAIVEWTPDVGPNLANFGAENFMGVGITDNGGYYGVNNLPHDYNNMFGCTGNNCQYYNMNDRRAWTDSIIYDPGDVPYDQYAVRWQNYQ